MDPISQLRMDFNRHLIDAIGGEVFNQSLFAWNGGITKYMLGFCLAIAFFQSVLRSEREFLVEWIKIVIATWFAMAILGGVNYRNVPGLAKLDSVPEKYQVKGGQKTLDRAVFNYLAYTFDSMGEGLKDSAGTDLNTEMANLNTVLSRFITLKLYCDTSDPVCVKKALTGERDKELLEEAKKETSNGSGMFDIVPYLKALVANVVKWMNPWALLFSFALFILDLARAFMNYFILLTFGLTAALSLFMLKVITPFMVIPSYRGRVIGGFKIVASTTLFGLATNLILYLSIVITKALNYATATILIARLTSSGALLASAELSTLMVGNFLTACVILAMQIVAIAKVPKFTKSLMNLSLEEIVNIGEQLVSAGMGIAKMAAGMGAALATGGAGLAMGALKSTSIGNAASQGMSSLAEKGEGKFRSLVGASPSKKEDGGGQTFFQESSTKGLGRGGSGGSGGGDVNAQLMGGGVTAKTQSGSGIIDPKKSAASRSEFDTEKHNEILNDSNISAEERIQKMKELHEKGANKSDNEDKSGKYGQSETVGKRSILQREKQKHEADIRGGAIDRAKSYIPSLKQTGAFLGNLASDGLDAGAGVGNGTGTLGKGMKDFGAKVANDGSDVSEYIQEKMRNSAEPNFNDTERAILTNQMANFGEGGRQDMSEIDSQKFEQNLSKIATGNASNDDMANTLAMKNQMNLSSEQQQKFDQVQKSSAAFNKVVQDEQRASEELLAKAKNQMSNGGQLDNKTMQEMVNRSSSGLMDVDAFKNASYSQKGMDKDGKVTSTPTSMLSSLRNQANSGIDNSLSNLAQSAKSGGLSQEQKMEANMLGRFSGEQLIGNKDRIDKMEAIYGGTKDLSHLNYNVDESSSSIKTVMNAINEEVEAKSFVDLAQGAGLEYNKDGLEAISITDSNNEKISITNMAELQSLKDQEREIVSKKISELSKMAYQYSNPEVARKANLDENEIAKMRELTTFLEKGQFDKLIFDKIVDKINKK